MEAVDPERIVACGHMDIDITPLLNVTLELFDQVFHFVVVLSWDACVYVFFNGFVQLEGC